MVGTSTLEDLIRWLSAIVGLVLVVSIFYWAMRILMVPTASTPHGARIIFRTVRNLMHLAGTFDRVQGRRRQLWALYVPISLLAVIAYTLTVTLVGYTFIYYGVSQDSLRISYVNSVSTLSVLGFAGEPSTLLQTTLTFAEAFTGPIMVALLITYLATMNASFNQRQRQLQEMDRDIGKVTSGPDLLAREAKGAGIEAMSPTWKTWASEFALMEADYDTVQGYLLLFAPSMRSHWVTDALVVLDAANIRNNVLAMPVDADADGCLTHGAAAISLSVKAFHHHVISFHHTTEAAEVTHQQFQQACANLVAAGVPLRPDLDAAWQTVQACRATYVGPVRKMAEMMESPLQLW
jgi:hypothetical protein